MRFLGGHSRTIWISAWGTCSAQLGLVFVGLLPRCLYVNALVNDELQRRMVTWESGENPELTRSGKPAKQEPWG
ncbi:hypothetical protein CIP107571_00636 [Corynebacterium diphtheriae]|nr:hypothetical protein CIP107571_00636 [Corynebacterium diphtheriae]